MEANLYSMVSELNTSVHEYHTEIVQRLTALETLSKGLPERVATLETDKAARVGGWHVLTLVANFVVTLIGFIFYRKH